MEFYQPEQLALMNGLPAFCYRAIFIYSRSNILPTFDLGMEVSIFVLFIHSFKNAHFEKLSRKLNYKITHSFSSMEFLFILLKVIRIEF